MDFRSFSLDMILEYLKNKDKLTELEQDLISSINELQQCTTNRQSLINKIKENTLKYADIQAEILMQPGAVITPFEEITDDGLKNNLLMQIQRMWLKEVSRSKII